MNSHNHHYENIQPSTSSSNLQNSNNEKSLREQLNDLKLLLQESEQRIMQKIDSVRDETEQNFKTMFMELDEIQRIEIRREERIICSQDMSSTEHSTMMDSSSGLVLSQFTEMQNDFVLLNTMEDFNNFEQQICDPQTRHELVISLILKK